MLTYDFAAADVPMYEYLRDRVRKDILSGVLPPGSRLPSKRSLAAHNGISVITVQNAYDQLAAEGWIRALPRRGYFVADLAAPAGARPERPARAEEGGGEEERPAIDLSDNRTSPAVFPFSVWARIMRRVTRLRRADLMKPSPAAGVYELRAAIAEHLRSFRGLTADPERVVVGAGSEYLYGILLRLIGTDKIYCLEDPGHRKTAMVYADNGAELRFARVDEGGMIVADLRASGADVAHLSPGHHFPTGAAMPAGRRYELLAWANERPGRYVVEDDYDSEFRVSGRPAPTLKSLDALGKVVYMNTFSKSLASTVRVSYMVLPDDLAARFRSRLALYSSTVSNFEQYALAEFIRLGFFEKHLNRARLRYARLRARALECVARSSFAGRCEVVGNDAGLHFLLRVDTDLSDAEFKRRLLARGVRVSALSDYARSGAPGDTRLFLVDYSNLSIDDLAQALEIMSGAVG